MAGPRIIPSTPPQRCFASLLLSASGYSLSELWTSKQLHQLSIRSGNRKLGIIVTRKTIEARSPYSYAPDLCSRSDCYLIHRPRCPSAWTSSAPANHQLPARLALIGSRPEAWNETDQPKRQARPNSRQLALAAPIARSSMIEPPAQRRPLGTGDRRFASDAEWRAPRITALLRWNRDPRCGDVRARARRRYRRDRNPERTLRRQPVHHGDRRAAAV